VSAQPAIARRIGMGLLALSAMLLTSCAGGQHAQTADQTPAIDGTNGAVGPLSLHIVAVQSPLNGTTIYPAGAAARMSLAIVNNGAADDTLTNISTPAATGWGVYGSDAEAEAVASAAVSPAPTPSGSASASVAPGLPNGATSVTIPAGNSVSFGAPVSTQVLMLLGLTDILHTGNSVLITFTFQRAGAVTLSVPVQLATTPVGSTIPPVVTAAP